MSTIQTELASEFLGVSIPDLKRPAARYDLKDLVVLKPDIDSKFFDCVFNSLDGALGHHHQLSSDISEIERSVIFHSMLLAINGWIADKHNLKKRKDLVISMETDLSMRLHDQRPLKGFADYTLQRDATQREKESSKDDPLCRAPEIQYTSSRFILVIELNFGVKQSALYLEKVKRVNKFKKVSFKLKLLMHLQSSLVADCALLSLNIFLSGRESLQILRVPR